MNEIYYILSGEFKEGTKIQKRGFSMFQTYISPFFAGIYGYCLGTVWKRGFSILVYPSIRHQHKRAIPPINVDTGLQCLLRKAFSITFRDNERR